MVVSVRRASKSVASLKQLKRYFKLSFGIGNKIGQIFFQTHNLAFIGASFSTKELALGDQKNNDSCHRWPLNRLWSFNGSLLSTLSRYFYHHID